MLIRRAPRPEGAHRVASDDVANDPRLSWPARGLLAYLINQPGPWTHAVDHLMREAPDTEDAPNDLEAIYDLLHELMIAGYVQRKEISRDDGVVEVVEYHVNATSIEVDPVHVEQAAAAMFARLSNGDAGQTAEVLRRLN
ncbi:hypothetical protein [Ideonella sp.]|uniref:hypothetical protein n=1 Tax=Ideonella sp. TaxID=1929293 RepID=UPI0035B245EC